MSEDVVNTPTGRQAQTVRDAILIKVPPLPSPRIANVQSFFGAAPLMPPTCPWPRKDVGSRSRPLTFIAQIALHEIPPRISSPLPRAGSLCFFVDLTKEYLDEHDARVIYFEDPFDACVAHRAPTPFADEVAGPWFWLEADELGANRLDKFPIEFMWFSSHAESLRSSVHCGPSERQSSLRAGILRSMTGRSPGASSSMLFVPWAAQSRKLSVERSQFQRNR